MATTKAPMHQTRKKINYTNPKYPKRQEELSLAPQAQRTNKVFINIIDRKWQIAIGLTGKSPATSNRGNIYLFVSYD